MARPAISEDADNQVQAISEQIAIGLRAYIAARKAPDPATRGSLYAVAVSHLGTTLAKIEKERRANG